jgi:hypothetical protein
LFQTQHKTALKGELFLMLSDKPRCLRRKKTSSGTGKISSVRRPVKPERAPQKEKCAIASKKPMKVNNLMTVTAIERSEHDEPSVTRIRRQIASTHELCSSINGDDFMLNVL